MRGARSRWVAFVHAFVAVWASMLVGGGAEADPVLVGAGDIGTCGASSGAGATAALLDAIPGTVFTTGDNAYPDGTASDFANCYDPTWGRHRARTRPSPGNHDWHTTAAQGYLDYFAGIVPQDRYWYSYDLGDWHIISLDSNCSDVGGCGVGSPQEQWLRADLAATDKRCIAAYWHHPLFSSGSHGSDPRYVAFWNALIDAGADIVLNGHDHHYERFAKLDAAGNPDPNGLRQFTVGTGGANLRGAGSVIAGSVKLIDDAFGVLKLTLRSDGYDWAFVSTVGDARGDWGGDSCTDEEPSSGTITWTQTIKTGADTTISKDKPFYPGGRRLSLRSDRTPMTTTLVRFNVRELAAPVVSAMLRLWVTDPTRDGPAVRVASNDWRESRVSWATQPHMISPVYDDVGRLPKGRWAVFDVTGAVTDVGQTSFALVGRSGDGVGFRAREFNGAKAQLVLTLRQEGTVDASAPYTHITAGPSDPTIETSASLAFAASEDGATFECKLDDASWSSCTSPAVFLGLTPGQHSFRVRASDGDGNTHASPARWTWTVS